MKPFDYNKYLKNNPLLKEVDESWNPIKKVKDYLGYKGITIGSARRPTPEEEQIAREYMKSQGKELGSIGVDKYTGNINVMETNGDFRAVLDPDGEELGAWEMQFESSLQEASLQDLLKPLTSKLKSMGYEVDYDRSFGFLYLEAFKTLPDGSVLRMALQPSEAELQQKGYNRPTEESTTIDVDFTHWTTQVTKKLFGLYKQKTRVMNRLPDDEGNNIDLGVGMFDIPVEQSVERVINLVKKAEAKVSGGTPTRQFTGDADADFMGEAKSNTITTIEPIKATLASDSTKKITIPKGSKVKVLIKRMPKEPKVTQLDYNGQKVNVNAEPFITQYLS